MAARDLVIGGLHAVSTALAERPADCLELFLRSSQAQPEIEARAAAMGLPIQRVEDRTLERLYGDGHHQGVVLRRRSPPLHELDALLGEPREGDAPLLLLVLDSIQDPRNFGACLRVADGAGVDAVVFPRDKSARLGDVVAKAASGAIDTVALVAVSNLAAAMVRMRRAGVWITGAAHDGDASLYEVDFTPASAIVLGNEGDGLRRLTRERCDRLAAIPMAGQLHSLNVATAAAVCLFEARRQRGAASA